MPGLLAELDQELGRSEKFRKLPPLMNKPRSPLDFLMLQFSRMNWRVAVAVLAGLIFLVLAVAVIRSRTRKPVDPLKNLGPGLYKPRQVSADTLPLPTNPPPRR